LTPFTLAIWFMDDGYYVKYRGVKFAKLSFTRKEVAELILDD
jgi:hypothetical protein